MSSRSSKWFVRTQGRQIESLMALDLNIIPAVTAMRQGAGAGRGDRAPGPAHPRLPGEDQHHLDDQHQHQHHDDDQYQHDDDSGLPGEHQHHHYYSCRSQKLANWHCL